MSDYTPTMDEFRAHLRSVHHLVGRVPDQDGAMFDRMLAAHDAEVKAEALREAADAVVESGGGIYSVGGDDWLRDRADSIDKKEK